MTTQSHEGTAASPHTPPPGGRGGTERRTARRRPNLGLDRFSGLYVWIVVIALFALWIPDTFMTQGNFRIIAGDQAITAMLAIGLIVPLAAGVFDLSIAGIMGFSVAMVSYQLSQGVSTPIAVVTTLLCGALIGAVNGFVVVKLKVDSFIATLGMSSILLAGTYWVTDGKQITEGFTDGFLDLGSKPFLGLPLPFFYMIGVAAVMYVVLEKTPLGRYFYATGGNRQAARLAGLRVERIMFGALMTSATIAAFTGVVLAAKLGTAAPDIGPSYLLPAFSAVFLGSTQIRAGRVNVLGTLIAIYLLATGVKGLQLAGAPSFVNDLFNGLALIVAVALAARTARRT
ncbi:MULTISPECIES: ABC transporter permease [unclassified Rhodococcus (in: high G+C Gram-positive bacteria)]|uniref:ABC transporter permease n=1 Tax=unclassified Rhodococcus (in: high G+C Gram-positive bacteria) TaxID=192944 RepID=UPI0007BB7A04|nr:MULTISPECIES: ABC transporter permease [unclassified Rhodococcus (in: high G+C Gram-positive bacteria)]KZF00852.1 sugar ABC transporter permease [Rhodococcus sp. EPR-279]KZF02167.1 sugar ABC transporter permease [Rhodococcus sp. EPR-147]